MLEAGQRRGDVPGHGEGNSALVSIKEYLHPEIFVTRPIDGYLVLLTQDSKVFLGVRAGEVLDTEVVYDKGESEAVGDVAEEPSDERILDVAVVGEVGHQDILRKLACLRKAIHGLGHFEENAVAATAAMHEGPQGVFLYDMCRNLI